MYRARYVQTDGGEREEPLLVNVLEHQADERPSTGSSATIQWPDLANSADQLARAWHPVGIPRGLVEHALLEGLSSDQFMGQDVSELSPLGKVDEQSAGRWVSNELSMARMFESDLVPALEAGNASDGALIAHFSLNPGREALAALSFQRDSFLVPWPSDADELAVSIDEVDRQAAEGTIWSRLDEMVPAGDRIELVLWRVYSGENSWGRDVMTTAKRGTARLLRDGLEGAALVAGRLIKLRAKQLASNRRDPRARNRRAAAEALSPVGSSCPGMDTRRPRVNRCVVVVHGTNSTGLRLAEFASDCAPPDSSIRRFEHDTWQPLEQNAAELAQLVGDQISDEVLFIAHSRGGLVAARAVQLLGQGGPAAELITLGTPFTGTPVAVTTDVLCMAVNTAMGALLGHAGKAVAVTGMAANVYGAGARLAALALRVTPPQGLTVMYPHADALPILRQYLSEDVKCIAGTSDGDTGKRWGLGGALEGVGRGVFGSSANDLVVATDSASGGKQPHLVPCDHFSYLRDPAVRAVVSKAIDRLRPDAVELGEKPEVEIQTW